MAVTSRNSLPQEFLDLTSSKMLIQPEPQYLFARLVFNACAQAELKKAAVTVGVDGELGRQAPVHGAPGQDMSDLQLMLNDDIRAEAVMVDMRLMGQGDSVIGHSVRFNRHIFANTTYTEASRIIDSNTAVSTTGISFAEEQVNITTKMVGGPYDSTNSRIAPFPVFLFDAQRSIHSISDAVALQLARDRMKYLDTVFAGYYSAGNVNVFPGDPANAITTAASAFQTAADRMMDVETIWRAEENLRTASIPKFKNGKYMAVLSPQQIRQLRSDPEYGKNAVYDSSLNVLKQSYVTTVGAVEIYESSTIATATANSVTYQKGCIFGPQAVGFLPAMQAHTRSANEDNFGLTPRVIWAAAEGHSLIDNRMICGIYSD